MSGGRGRVWMVWVVGFGGWCRVWVWVVVGFVGLG